jgi:hypothetical protein
MCYNCLFFLKSQGRDVAPFAISRSTFRTIGRTVDPLGGGVGLLPLTKRLGIYPLECADCGCGDKVGERETSGFKRGW